MIIKLIYKCKQPKLLTQNVPKQNHISIHNPVYEPNFELKTETEKEEPSLYQDLDPKYGSGYDQITDEYLEIVND